LIHRKRRLQKSYFGVLLQIRVINGDTVFVIICIITFVPFLCHKKYSAKLQIYVVRSIVSITPPQRRRGNWLQILQFNQMKSNIIQQWDANMGISLVTVQDFPPRAKSTRLSVFPENLPRAAQHWCTLNMYGSVHCYCKMKHGHSILNTSGKLYSQNILLLLLLLLLLPMNFWAIFTRSEVKIGHFIFFIGFPITYRFLK
jgi:hypothetical protein